MKMISHPWYDELPGEGTLCVNPLTQQRQEGCKVKGRTLRNNVLWMKDKWPYQESINME